jgi:hypothetical protein
MGIPLMGLATGSLIRQTTSRIMAKISVLSQAQSVGYSVGGVAPIQDRLMSETSHKHPHISAIVEQSQEDLS